MTTDATIYSNDQVNRSEADLDPLGEFIFEHFPAEAVGTDLTVREEVEQLAIELLERLWRWEH